MSVGHKCLRLLSVGQVVGSHYAIAQVRETIAMAILISVDLVSHM